VEDGFVAKAALGYFSFMTKRNKLKMKNILISLVLFFCCYSFSYCSEEDVRGTDISLLPRYPNSVRIEYEFYNESEEYYQNIKTVGPTYYISYNSKDSLDKIKDYYNNYIQKNKWEIIFFEQSSNGDKWIIYFSKDDKNYFAELQTSSYDEDLSTNKITYRFTEETMPSIAIDIADIKNNLDKNNKVILPNVFFLFNSNKFKEDRKSLLKNIANLLKAYANYVIKILVHSEAIGSKDKLIKITQAQADSIKKYLLSAYSFSEDKVIAIGKGSNEPLTEKLTPEDRFLNKRIEIIIEKNN